MPQSALPLTLTLAIAAVTLLLPVGTLRAQDDASPEAVSKNAATTPASSAEETDVKNDEGSGDAKPSAAANAAAKVESIDTNTKRDDRKAGALDPLRFPEKRSATTIELRQLSTQLPRVLRSLIESGDDDVKKVARELDTLARESSELAKLLPEETDRLRARHLELQAYNALAQQAHRSRQEREASYRVSQIRSAALGARDLEQPLAVPLADFWLLQADLFDINRSDAPLHTRQRRATVRLERFLEDHPEKLWKSKKNATEGAGADAGAEAGKDDGKPIIARPATEKVAEANARQLLATMVTQVRLALLHLYDQRGESEKAAKTLKAVLADGVLAPAKQSAVRDQFASLQTLGKHFAAELPLSNGKSWSTRDRAGRPVIVLFYSPRHERSKEAFDRLAAMSASLRVKGVDLLFVRTPHGGEDDVTDFGAAMRKTFGLDGDGSGGASEAAGNTTAKKPSQAAGGKGNGLGGGPGVYDEATGRVKLSRVFAVRSLPRYVLIDKQGKLRALADSEVVLEQIDTLLQ